MQSLLHCWMLQQLCSQHWLKSKLECILQLDLTHWISYSHYYFGWHLLLRIALQLSSFSCFKAFWRSSIIHLWFMIFQIKTKQNYSLIKVYWCPKVFSCSLLVVVMMKESQIVKNPSILLPLSSYQCLSFTKNAFLLRFYRFSNCFYEPSPKIQMPVAKTSKH